MNRFIDIRCMGLSKKWIFISIDFHINLFDNIFLSHNTESSVFLINDESIFLIFEVKDSKNGELQIYMPYNIATLYAILYCIYCR